MSYLRTLKDLSAGDFHQLPPVAKGATMLAVRRFAFEADCWSSCISACMILRKVFRQVSHTAAFAEGDKLPLHRKASRRCGLYSGVNLSAPYSLQAAAEVALAQSGVVIML